VDALQHKGLLTSTQIPCSNSIPTLSVIAQAYDRNLASNTFTIDQGILEKMLEFAPREWLLSSYIATGIDNVPIFIKADNVAEKEIESVLCSR
jgi:uncharacterized protein